jgi:hypothetical protein
MLKSFSVFLLLVDVADFVMDFTYTRMLARDGYMGHAAWLGCVLPMSESKFVLRGLLVAQASQLERK